MGGDRLEKEPNPILTAVQIFTQRHTVWGGYAAALLDELKTRTDIDAEPNTLTRLLNASIGDLEREYGVRYRSGKRTGKGRLVYLTDLSIPGMDVDNVGNDGILNTGDGRKNTYNTYTTYTDAPDGQEGA